MLIRSHDDGSENEDPRVGVPTTYYAAVQLIGTATVLAVSAATAGVLREQLAALDRRAAGWSRWTGRRRGAPSYRTGLNRHTL